MKSKKKASLPAPFARLRARLLKSGKFLSWPRVVSKRMMLEGPSVVETHYSPAQLAKIWGLSVETIRSIFRDEPGVLKVGKTGAKHRRGYVTLRISREVVERVHTRLSA